MFNSSNEQNIKLFFDKIKKKKKSTVLFFNGTLSQTQNTWEA
jgi:hypothetical protein